MRTTVVIALLLALFSATIAPSKILGQDSLLHSSTTFRANAHYGFLIPHSSGMEILAERHVSLFELQYEKSNHGSQSWHQLYNYPTWGITFVYSQLSSREKLGTGTGVYPYFGFTVLKRKKLKMTWRLGGGLGYISKPFNPEDNFKNIAIGSYVNIVASTGARLEWKLSESMALNSGVVMTHFSNGAFSKPNLGINIPSTFVGLTFGEFDNKVRDRSITDIPHPDYAFQVLGTVGLKQISPPGNKRYFTSTTSLEAQRLFSAKHALTFGFDVMYNTALKDQKKRLGDTISSNSEIVQPGARISYHMMFGRFELVGGSGVYLANRFKEDLPWYNRLGIRYFLTDNIVGNFSLKTHLFKADYLELGLGYRLPQRNNKKQAATK